MSWYSELRQKIANKEIELLLKLDNKIEYFINRPAEIFYLCYLRHISGFDSFFRSFINKMYDDPLGVLWLTSLIYKIYGNYALRPLTKAALEAVKYKNARGQECGIVDTRPVSLLRKFAKKMGMPVVAGPLIKALNDENAYVRACAADALRQLAEDQDMPDAVGPLINALEDSDHEASQRARVALENLGDDAVGPLVKKLEDKNFHVRWGAAEALEGMVAENGGPLAAIHGLIKACEDEDEHIRSSAINGLEYAARKKYAVKKTAIPEAFKPLIEILVKEAEANSTSSDLFVVGKKLFASITEKPDTITFIQIVKRISESTVLFKDVKKTHELLYLKQQLAAAYAKAAAAENEKRKLESRLRLSKRFKPPKIKPPSGQNEMYRLHMQRRMTV